MKRRTFLKAVAVGAVSLSGCTGSSGSNPPENTTPGNTATESAELNIAQLALSNQDDEPHTLAVTITESGETVFQVESEVEPAEYENGRPVVLNGHRVQGLPTEPGAYVIRASVDGRDQDVFETSGVARSGVPCIPVRVVANEDGSSVTIWYTTARSYCE